MNTTITNSSFIGGNLDGSSFVDNLNNPTEIKMDGWYCIGPMFYGKPTWRMRLAWKLLGLVVRVRNTNVELIGQPPSPPNPRSLYVVDGDID